MKKIHVFDTDQRKLTDPLYSTNMGSFGIVAHELNQGLKEIGAYAEPDEADFVGVCDGLNMGFRYKDKKPFVINVWDMINVLPEELVHSQWYYKTKIIGFSPQVSELWEKYGVKSSYIRPGTDTNFYHQVCPKNEIFTILFDSFANVRAGLDLAIEAYKIAFGKQKNVQLIIKNTSDNKILAKLIADLQAEGYNIQFLNSRISSVEMRRLYSEAHVLLGVMRHSSWGLSIHQAAACNCVTVVGDFNPSNTMAAQWKIKPVGEVNISDTIPQLINHYGLHNAYGNFSYREEPRFYEYDVSLYANLLVGIFRNYSIIELMRDEVVNNWTNKQAAEDLVKALC